MKKRSLIPNKVKTLAALVLGSTLSTPAIAQNYDYDSLPQEFANVLNEDPDSDGRITHRELAEGTDPNVFDYNIPLQITPNLNLEFSSIENPENIGYSIQLYQSQDLINWTPYTGEIAFADNVKTAEIDFANNTFYIIAEQQIPNTAPNLSNKIENLLEDESKVVILPSIDSDGDTIQYTKSGHVNINTSINGNEITLQGNPDSNGDYQAYFNSSDGKATRAFRITGNIAPVNDAPEQDAAIQAIFNTQENTPINIDATPYFKDIDTPTLAYTIKNLTNASYEVNDGIITITPNTNYDGTIENLLINASDGEYNIDSNPFNLVVSNDINQPPIALTIPGQNMNEDSETPLIFDVKPYFFDPDTTGLTYNITITNASATQENGVFTITPDQNWNGNINATITAYDGTTTVPNNLGITVNPVNDAPTTIGTIADLATNEDEPIQLDAKPYFIDIDNETLAYTLANLVNGSVNQTNGVFTITPAQDYNGEITGLKINATDGEENVDSNNFKLTVNPVNDAPYWASNPTNFSMDQDSTTQRNYSTRAADIDDEQLDLGLIVTNVQNGTATPNQLNVDVTPTAGFTGEMSYDVQITDGDLLSEKRSIIVTVNDIPPTINTPTGLEAQEDVEYTLDLTGLASADQNRFELYQNGTLLSNGSTTIEGETITKTAEGVYKFTGIQDANGLITGLKAKVYDELDQTAETNTFSIDRLPVNDAPVLGDAPNQETDQGVQLELDFGPYATDVDNPNNELSVVLENLGDANYTTNGLVATITPGPNDSNGITAKIFDGEKYSNTDTFNLKVNQSVNIDAIVDFIFKSASYDTNLTSGNFTVIAQPVDAQGNPIGDPIEASDTDGTVRLILEKGQEYDVNGFWDGSIDLAAVGQEGFYTFLRGAAHEQRSRDDTTSIVSFENNNNTVDVYKLQSDFPLILFYQSASVSDGGLNTGIRRFSDSDLTVPVWYNLNHLPPTADLETWIQELCAELGTIPHMNKWTFQYQKGTTEPASPRIILEMENGYLDGNVTNFNSTTHHINWGKAQYTPTPGERTTDIELYQAIGDLRDIGTNNPPIQEQIDGKWQLNSDGRRIFAVMYLVDPKTKF
jgi:hypothetical protein